MNFRMATTLAEAFNVILLTQLIGEMGLMCLLAYNILTVIRRSLSTRYWIYRMDSNPLLYRLFCSECWRRTEGWFRQLRNIHFYRCAIALRLLLRRRESYSRGHFNHVHIILSTRIFFEVTFNASYRVPEYTMHSATVDGRRCRTKMQN